jgi:hypothetical protein
MADFQIWLVRTLPRINPAMTFMHSKWGWPTCETLHFIGLSLLIGTIFMFDLRLLGMAKRIPIGALHRLVPWGVGGYALNVVTGLCFLMTEPNQYIYNPSFHYKVLFMGLAGLNVLTFYSAVFRKVRILPAGADTPVAAKMIASASLCLWIGVIVCGRLLTFYRPFQCGPNGPGFLSICIP